MPSTNRHQIRQQITDLVEALGYNPTEVRRLSIEAGRVTVQRTLHDDQGRARLLPPDPDGGRRVDTTIDFIDIRL